MKVKLMSSTKNPEKIIAAAAKLCYAASDIDDIMNNLTLEKIDEFISILRTAGHESPFEHVSFTFGIEGISRITEQQLTRHRIASFSIQSGRYVDRANADFYIPDDIKNNPLARKAYVKVIEDSKIAYEKIWKTLLHGYILTHDKTYRVIPYHSIQDYNWDEDGCLKWFEENHRKVYNKFKKKAIENARSVFPNSLNTKIMVTMNVRSLFNFFNHRCCNRAQEEIKELAREMLKILKEVSPILFKNAGPSCSSGICPEGTMQCDQLKNFIPTNIEVKELINKYYKKELK